MCCARRKSDLHQDFIPRRHMTTERVSLFIIIVVHARTHARGPVWSILQGSSAADVESIDGILLHAWLGSTRTLSRDYRVHFLRLKVRCCACFTTFACVGKHLAASLQLFQALKPRAWCWLVEKNTCNHFLTLQRNIFYSIYAYLLFMSSKRSACVFDFYFVTFYHIEAHLYHWSTLWLN